ncbi:restriction endonuclease subunit S [Staphylococcus auricularis]|uniref:restriction endonuclease subunit S n=1 Tax=Staphylococcus auricularis TaxID=29379 RepID=UPI002DBDEC00|nr:restriction endonuclease subunit S [Staphylococcus auricularis]
MMKLSDREWKEFKLEDIFTISSGVRLEKKNLIKGDLPFITAISLNNGISDFVSNNNSSEDSNILGVNYDGSVVENFYHPYKAIFSDSVKRLKLRNVKGNKYIYLFLKAVIYKQKNKYQYGYKFNSGRMKKQFILLPVINNQPDYDFMEQYIKEKYFNLKSQIKEKQKHEITDYRELNQVEWKVFEMDDIFRFVQGKSKGLNHLKKGGNVPYLGAKYSDNGVLTFVETENNLMSKGNCISFIRNGEGSMGLSIYKSESHIATSDITNGYNDFLNRYTGKFISTISNLVRGKYNFGYKRSLTRLKKEKIKLPTKNNRPDYDFMEQYMKRKENEVLDRI